MINVTNNNFNINNGLLQQHILILTINLCAPALSSHHEQCSKFYPKKRWMHNISHLWILLKSSFFFNITVFCYKPLLTVQSVSNIFAKKWKTKTWMETLKSYKRCPGLKVRFGIMKNMLEILISTAQYAQEWTRPRWWVWSIIPTTRRSELKIGAWKTVIPIRYGA